MLVVGDVCGKGAEAAAVTALVRWTVRTGAKVSPSPAAVLAMCNQVILDAEIDNRFATVAVAMIEVDPEGGGAVVTVASGGHPLPLVRRLNGDAVPVGEPGPLLGVFPEGTWPETTMTLTPGEALLVFTDGLLEARSPSGSFAPQLLEQVLHATVGAEAAVTAQSVLRAVDALEQGYPRDDLGLPHRTGPPTGERARARARRRDTDRCGDPDERAPRRAAPRLQLVRLGNGDSGSAYAKRVLTVLGSILERFAEGRAALRDQAELAVPRPADLHRQLLLPPTPSPSSRKLGSILVQVAEFSLRGDLLTLPPEPEAILPTMEWFDEVVHQLEAGSRAQVYSGHETRSPGDRLEPAAVPVGGGPQLEVRRRASLHIEMRPDMARVARRFLDEVLDAWGEPHLAPYLSLPVTELVTNAQIHARTDVEVVLQETAAVVRVEVHDFSTDLPVIRSRERTAGTGRGLAPGRRARGAVGDHPHRHRQVRLDRRPAATCARAWPAAP